MLFDSYVFIFAFLPAVLMWLARHRVARLLRLATA
jgi:hypothetical protein